MASVFTAQLSRYFVALIYYYPNAWPLPFQTAFARFEIGEQAVVRNSLWNLELGDCPLVPTSANICFPELVALFLDEILLLRSAHSVRACQRAKLGLHHAVTHHEVVEFSHGQHSEVASFLHSTIGEPPVCKQQSDYEEDKYCDQDYSFLHSLMRTFNVPRVAFAGNLASDWDIVVLYDE